MSGSPTTVSGHPLDDGPMTLRQLAAIAVTVMLNALDGFDVLSISFAAPGIAKDWNIGKAALGVVLSMELVGMVGGSLLLGRMADRFGRRPTTLACLVLMSGGMLLSATARSIEMLSLYRILTGMGIGGMLATTNAIVSEMANLRRRSLAVSIMVIGYPAGAVLGGMIVAELLRSNGWQIIFLLGGGASAVMILLVLWLVPETPSFLVTRTAPGALERLNHSMRRLGREALPVMPAMPPRALQGKMSGLFTGGVGRTTALLTVAYFCQIATFYFIVKWTPKIVTEFGYDPSSAATVLVWANVGGGLGCLFWGLLAPRFGLGRVAGIVFVGSALGVSAFGAFSTGLSSLSVLAAVGGFFANAGVAALYNLAAVGFPHAYRASGTGFVIGVGRGGGVIGPILSGLLFQQNVPLAIIATVMGTGSVGALVAIALLLRHLRQAGADQG